MKFRHGVVTAVTAFTLLSPLTMVHAQTIGSLQGKSGSGQGQLTSTSPNLGEREGHKGSQYNSIFAEALMMSPILLVTQQSQGKTILQIAQSKHMTEASLIAKCVALYQQQLNAQVKKKQLSPALEKSMLQQFKSALPGLVTHNQGNHHDEGTGDSH